MKKTYNKKFMDEEINELYGSSFNKEKQKKQLKKKQLDRRKQRDIKKHSND
ncbi:MAG: hypothetical protein GX368_01805 [Erysipelotrichaceae bacterium]|jgi:hypothetical protein|nr:hypothetical protein [Erysipelotrichaceae bacterium]